VVTGIIGVYFMLTQSSVLFNNCCDLHMCGTNSFTWCNEHLNLALYRLSLVDLLLCLLLCVCVCVDVLVVCQCVCVCVCVCELVCVGGWR